MRTCNMYMVWFVSLVWLINWLYVCLIGAWDC
jgi:hypothetical protein